MSVVVPCYNGSTYLAETLRSVLEQTSPPLEIIVVDDGSTDDSADVARRMDPCVRVLRQSNQGESAARNRGIESAEGEWIAFCDADDIWVPTKLERQLEVVEPGIIGIHANYFSFGEEPHVVDLSRVPAELRYRLEHLATGGVVFISSLLVRRGLLTRFPVWTRYGEDLIYTLDLCLRGPLRLVPEPLAGYRLHPMSQSHVALVEMHWQETIETWLAARAASLPEETVLAIRRHWLGRLATVARSARWDRRWGDYWIVRQRLARYADLPEAAAALQERIWPRWMYQVNDSLDRFRHRNARHSAPPRLAQAEPVSVPTVRPAINLEGCTVIDESVLVPTFPIDVVFTWVDHDDPSFQKDLSAHLPERPAEYTIVSSRYSNYDELRYALRSLDQYAPWVNRIHIVTYDQRPRWLSKHPKINLVAHSDILDAEYLPTFNSHVIGSALHRIPDLAEHYIYFNDDVMLLRPATPTDFFTANGLAHGFIGSVELPEGGPLPGETPTNWAAKNARALVARKWGRALNRRFAHVCHPQLKSVAQECERLFAAEYHALRQNKLRKENDLLICSYLHPVAAYMMRCGVFARTDWWYVKVRNPTAIQLYDCMLSERGKPHARLVACLNDHPEEPGTIADFEDRLRGFLQSYFPRVSPFEERPK